MFAEQEKIKSHRPSQVHLRLAEAFLRVEQPQYASDSLAPILCHEVFRSSPLPWLLAGRALVKRNAAAEADLAFTEANLLDSELPEPWGWLALLSARLDPSSDTCCNFCTKTNAF